VRRIIRRFDGELVPDGDVDRLWGVACRRNAPSDVVLGRAYRRNEQTREDHLANEREHANLRRLERGD